MELASEAERRFAKVMVSYRWFTFLRHHVYASVYILVDGV